MKLEDIKKGMVLIEQIAGKTVKVVKINITKHYGPNCPVCVRFADNHTEYYAPEDLEIDKHPY